MVFFTDSRQAKTDLRSLFLQSREDRSKRKIVTRDGVKEKIHGRVQVSRRARNLTTTTKVDDNGRDDARRNAFGGQIPFSKFGATKEAAATVAFRTNDANAHSRGDQVVCLRGEMDAQLGFGGYRDLRRRLRLEAVILASR